MQKFVSLIVYIFRRKKWKQIKIKIFDLQSDPGSSLVTYHLKCGNSGFGN